ncbi:MAG: type III pantothenate kinase [Bacteroidota bacterium]
MNIVVDYGNSAAKVGIFDHQTLTSRLTFNVAEELRVFLEMSTAENLIVSSVSVDTKLVTDWAQSAKKKFILEPTLPLPVKILYATPATLGVDRIAAVCGAQQQFPLQHCLVIDAGTCLTYDFLDKHSNYHGGAISPGLNMRFQALHTFTARLPLISPAANVGLVGDSTESSIQSGVINGIIAEMDGIIEQYAKKFDNLRVILCGGDTRFFENKLKASIFASPELVLSGLNSILIHNVNH